MSHSRLFIAALLAVCSTTLAQPTSKDKAKDPAKPAAAQPPKTDKPAAPSPEDMQKMMMEMSSPGPEHAHLTKGVGTWDGKLKSYEDPSKPPQESTCTSVVTSIMGGRFISVDVDGAEMMPGMGPFKGHGINGYDKASGKYLYFWIDNMGTNFMTGTGELSADKKTMTWTITYPDPMTGKPGTMKEIERSTGDNTFTMEMFANDPTGKEVKMIEIAFTRRGGSGGGAVKPDAAKPSK